MSLLTDKELIAAKERQEIELTAQRQTLNEQRTHIDILDSALTNAQANVVKLEEEVRNETQQFTFFFQLEQLIMAFVFVNFLIFTIFIYISSSFIICLYEI